MKKRKLNSRNPKYMKIQIREEEKQNILMCTTKGVKIYATYIK